MEINCWEHFKCGRQVGGDKVDQLGVCPAAIDSTAHGLNKGINGGRICWAVSGTLCGGKARGTFAEKEVSCLSCKFYQKVEQEEGHAEFKIFKPGQTFQHRHQSNLVTDEVAGYHVEDSSEHS